MEFEMKLEKQFDQFNILIYEELKKTSKIMGKKTAIVCQGKQIDYNAFLSLVNQYISLLNAYKITKYDFVAIQMERSIEMVALLFATIYTGAAFFLTNKEYNVRYLSLIDVLPPTWTITKNNENGLQINPFGRNSQYLSLGETAYVFLTSGSTGKPKIILTSHESFFNTVRTLPKAFQFDINDCVGALSDIAFDVFLTETVIALCTGMKVILFDEKQCKQPRLLTQLIKEQGVNVLQTVPSRMRMILYLDPELELLRSVKKIYLGGEKVEPEFIRKLKSKISARIFHVYGTTEDSIWTSICEIDNSLEIEIGRLIEGHFLELLNENGDDVAIGEPGCIYLSGKGLFQGYAEDYISNTIKPIGKRKFCTGDYAVKTEDDKIFILGRKDNMVKIQGQRVELEEIESAAKSIHYIVEAVAKAYQNTNEDWIICLYYKSSAVIQKSDLEKELRLKLPQGAVPKLYFQIDKFDYLPSGKLDRNSYQFKFLYEKHKATVLPNHEDVAKKVCSIIAELCNHELSKINLNDSLGNFEITSIIFVKLVIECEKQFSIQFDNEDLDVELYSTIADLVKYICMRLK